MKTPIEIMDETERENVPRLKPGMLVLHQDWQQLRAALEAQAGKLAQYEQWVNDLQSGMYINCVYCGHRYGPDSDVPTSMADVLKEHIEECPKHPMSALKEELAQAQGRLALIRTIANSDGIDAGDALNKISRIADTERETEESE